MTGFHNNRVTAPQSRRCTLWACAARSENGRDCEHQSQNKDHADACQADEDPGCIPEPMSFGKARRPATWRALMASVDSIVDDIDGVSKMPTRPQVYLYFVGHGTVEANDRLRLFTAPDDPCRRTPRSAAIR